MPQVLLLVATGLVILFFGWRQFDRRTVVIAKEALSSGQVVGERQVGKKRVSRSDLPADAIREPGDIVGRTIRASAAKGQVLRVADFRAERPTVVLTDMIPEGRVLYTLNVRNQTTPFEGLRVGDSLDIVVAAPSSQDQRLRIANVIVRDVTMVGFVRAARNNGGSNGNGGVLGVDLSAAAASADDEEEKPALLMVAVRPEDVVPLAEVDGSGIHLAVVLHGKTEEEEERLNVKNYRERVQVIEGKGSKIISLP